MNHSVDPGLLIELARLVRRYGPQEFMKLSLALGDPAFCSQMKEMFSTLSKLPVSKTGKVRTETPELSKKSSILAGLREKDPLKYQMLEGFRQGVLARHLLPEVADLRDFALASGIKVAGKESREKVVNELMRALANLRIDELRVKLADVPARQDRAGEYERWVNLILARGSSSQSH